MAISDCSGFLGPDPVLKPIATDGTPHSFPEGMHTEYYQWDLFPYWHFIHNSSCWASMRLMLLLTCSNCHRSKQRTFSIIGYTHSVVHEMQIPLYIPSPVIGGMNEIKRAAG